MSRAPEIILPSYLGANYLELVQGENGCDWRQRSAEDDISRIVAAKLIEKKQMLDEVPHDEIGLNLPRMARFLGKHGLHMSPIAAVDEAGQQDINKIMGFDTSPDTQTFGSYFPLLDFTYVVRGAREAAEGTVAIEGSGIHELTHANQPHRDVAYYVCEGDARDIVYYPIRFGFVEQKGGHATGNLLEEGLAQLMSHKYRIEILGLDQSFQNGRRIETPAAYAMQLLIAEDPQIFPAILADRSDKTGLHEFPQRVNALAPGLLDILNSAAYGDKSAWEAVNTITNRLYKGDPEKALEAAALRDYQYLKAA